MEVQTKATEKAIWIDRPTIEEARSMLLGVLPDLPIRDVTANNRQRCKNNSSGRVHCKKLEQVGVIPMCA
ncbi:hypothetical protein GQ600_4019 [Phytophthora cactorum]|nr:hypothetical protein GQ600_4019 [Phytophthora cactorum]